MDVPQAYTVRARGEVDVVSLRQRDLIMAIGLEKFDRMKILAKLEGNIGSRGPSPDTVDVESPLHVYGVAGETQSSSRQAKLDESLPALGSSMSTRSPASRSAGDAIATWTCE